MSKAVSQISNKQSLKMKKTISKKALMGAVLLLASGTTFAQSNGIDAAGSELSTYIDPIGNLIIIIGAIVGLIGGVRVFIKWNNGDQDTNKAIMSWFGSCIFLVLVGVIITAFFGV
jgi:uncharacterized membrane protein